MQSHSGALEVVRRNGRWREMHGVGLFPECLNFPPRVGTPESSGAVTPIPCCRPAATVACWRRRLLGRSADGDGWGGSWGRDRQGEAAEPRRRQPARAAPIPPVPTLARWPSLPPSPCKSPPRHQRSHSFSEVAPPAPGSSCASIPITRAIYTSKAQGEKSNNPHTLTESNKHRHRPGGLPEPFCQAGSWASPQSPCPVELR